MAIKIVFIHLRYIHERHLFWTASYQLEITETKPAFQLSLYQF